MRFAIGTTMILVAATPAMAANWPAPTPGPITGTSGYVQIPDVAVPRDPRHVYKALFDVTKGPADKAKPLGRLVGIAGQYNGLALGKVPVANMQFAAIFHGPSVDAILTDEAYRAKHGVANPNLPLIAQLVKMGLKIYVCGQFMAATDLPRSALIKDAQVAEGATLVMIRMVNDGYALIGD
ncbi:DsrE family protein [Sphingomonas quercus]|uniref:DsrE family protein n=1 Tax=Sphingomonas quercus TaxID=2842451 RepID=A0ABS6BJM2_9SPHN|nr:DsrE family protein [Sphingomonas quercus]MBU3078508.1 DsrE family protein [Sphingomonas quercus]